jgi:hypothetical protein
MKVKINTTVDSTLVVLEGPSADVISVLDWLYQEAEETAQEAPPTTQTNAPNDKPSNPYARYKFLTDKVRAALEQLDIRNRGQVFTVDDVYFELLQDYLNGVVVYDNRLEFYNKVQDTLKALDRQGHVYETTGYDGNDEPFLEYELSEFGKDYLHKKAKLIDA